ncbi:tryptophan-rich sensory protein TspO [Primorskyibacter sp. S187A]|uniref:tryptophan-rich sensory protein TspO n=1 Tax=Primorskyibacter sp. S187A TaxID=3415130 RepID=UPI003C7C6DA9
MFWLFFAIFLVACCGAGLTGGLFPPGPWYRALAKPSWTPPDWVFPVTWTTLYVCMSLAGARVAMQPSPEAMLALALWAGQVAFNGLWTPVFFGLQRIKAGLFVLIALWVLVAATLWALWRVDMVAGLLFAPYLLWVTIAGALNISVWRLNPDEAKNPPAIET